VPKGVRKNVPSVHRDRLCIVMTCDDAGEAAEVGRLISQLNMVSLVTYRKSQDVLMNYPAGRVALIILANAEDPEAMGTTLAWMRHRWPHCPITVIGDRGAGELEMVARTGGASFMTRPVRPAEWSALIHHVLKKEGRVVEEAGLG